MTGCGNQSTSSTSAPAESSTESTEAATGAEQTQDEIIADLKAAAANPFPFKSVTITEAIKSASTDEEAAADNKVTSKTVYKLDASGDKLRTSMVAEIDDIKLEYHSEGTDAVIVTDGPIYSGTTEQFGMPHFDGIESYFTDTFGDLHKIIDCVDTVTKEQQGDVTVYTITVNPEKYTASDEILTMMAEHGDPLKSATFTFGFDQEGRMVSAEDVTEYAKLVSQRAITLSDFDSTVVEPMPEADRTYEQMEQDEQMKYDALAKQLEGAQAAEEAEASADADKAK